MKLNEYKKYLHTSHCKNKDGNSLDNRTVTSESLNIFKGNMERPRSSKVMGLFIGN